MLVPRAVDVVEASQIVIYIYIYIWSHLVVVFYVAKGGGGSFCNSNVCLFECRKWQIRLVVAMSTVLIGDLL